MLDIDIEEQLIKKVGGKFKLTTLVQKRMVELHRPGARMFVKADTSEELDLLRITLQEILEEKIELAPREEVGYPLEEETLLLDRQPPQPEPEDEEQEQGASPEIYGSDIKKIKEQRIKELAELLNPHNK